MQATLSPLRRLAGVPTCSRTCRLPVVFSRSVLTNASSEASSSEGDLSCSGKPKGFGSLRKNFQPTTQKKKTGPGASGPKTMNGRDKAEVLAQTSAEVMAKLAAARAAAAAAASNGSSSSTSTSGSEVASGTGSVASATSSEDWVEDWRRSDAKVNKYPDMREFTAVGAGGDDFKAAMVKCVEDVVGGPAPVTTRASSGGNYLSVRVGPVRVESPEQVLAVFLAMRKDPRLKFHL